MVDRMVLSAQHASVAIVGHDRNVIVSNQAQQVFEQVNFGFHPEIGRALSGESETTYDVHWGKDYLESVVRIPETGWVVWVGQDYAQIIAPVIALRQTLIVFLVATLLAALVAAVRKSSMLMKPIQELLQRTIRFGQGEPPGSDFTSRYSEIEALSAGMMEMFEAISVREGSLRASEERFRLVFSLSPDSVFLVHFVSGPLIDVNQGLANLCGGSRDELLERSVQGLPIWSEPRQWGAMHDRLRLRGRFANLEITLRTPSGERNVLASANRFDVGGESLALVILHDITDIRDAEKRLRLNEERYRTVVESIEEGLVVFNESGTIVACNPAEEAYLGPRDTLIGKAFRDWQKGVVHGYGRAWEAQELPVARSLRYGVVVRNELMGLPSAEGNTTWIEVNSSPLLGGERGDISGAVVTFSDVTDRQQRRELLDNVASGVTRRTGTAFFDSLTRSLASALKADYVMVSEIHPDRPGFFRTISVMTPAGVGENMEYERHGTPCQVATESTTCSFRDRVQDLFPDDQLLVEMGIQAYIGRVLNNERGEPLGLVAVMYRQPIEESVLAEQLLQIFAARAEAEMERIESMEALRSSEKHLRRLSQEFEALLEGIPDQILLVDRDYRLIWANHSPEKNLDDYPEFCHQIFYDREQPCAECPVTRALQTGVTEENEMTSPEGRHFMMRAVPILDVDGRVEKVIQMVQNITDKVRLQQSRQHANQLAALGELAAGVAHEINNPVNGIINYAQLLKNRFGENKELASLTDRVIAEGNRIATIVGELLFFAREGGDEVHVTSWKQVIDDSLLLVGNQLRKDHVEIEVAIPGDLPQVASISTQLQQVVLNLFSNARHALNEKFPEASPEKRIVIEGGQRDKGRVELVVTDFGPGIPQGVLHKVMQPFYTTKPAGVGTGLGLSICHEIISRHGGSIEIESEPDQFTRVRIVLPSARYGVNLSDSETKRAGSMKGGI